MSAELKDYWQKMDYRLTAYVEERDGQRANFARLFADEGVRASIERELLTSIRQEGDAIRMESAFGGIEVEYVPHLTEDGVFWAAILKDIDERGNPRDLYAIYLLRFGQWVDSTGIALREQEWSEILSAHTAHKIVKRSLAAKMRFTSERLEKIRG